MGTQHRIVSSVMAAAGFGAGYHRHVRPWMYTWGADPTEVDAELPGDDLVGAHLPRTTRAVTIDAAPDEVWPWLAQIGEGRGGFYSYAWLERLVGADIHNADRVHPDWQELHVGDTVWLARRFGPRARQVVAAVAENSHLVLVSPPDFDRLGRGEKASGAWVFVVRGIEGGWSRLLVRGSGGAVGKPWFDIPHFVMEQKMMRGIRERAEKLRSEKVLTSARTPRLVTEAHLR
ncbi:hypothetical protein [Mycolicibacterium arenosum]|uniref:Polyketide cyclase n=1 Tax=Mycolicibacterium arenosum TaxID=2952157 RepID=A0ABT1LUN5_9MYCO|nr:hypothetical protein [Mycolicibacterium sp. CAU 1645]MCP9270613.1 hypothetical protein [Mycolicibacterium sp. CAU 1645]